MQGADERYAYEAQLTALTLLGRGPGTPLHSSVRRAMLTALREKKKRDARSLFARNYD
jgi:hypothetical protein